MVQKMEVRRDTIAALIVIIGILVMVMLFVFGAAVGYSVHQTNRTCILVPAGDPTAQPYCVWGETR